MKFVPAPTNAPAESLADAIRNAAEVVGPLGVYVAAVALCAVVAAYLARAL